MRKKLLLVPLFVLFTMSFVILGNDMNSLSAGETQSYTERSANPQTTSAVLYYNPGCSHCKKVLAYLSKRNKTLLMKNTSNPQYRQELQRLGQRGVPVLVVGSKVVVGGDAIIAYLSQHEELLY